MSTTDTVNITARASAEEALRDILARLREAEARHPLGLNMDEDWCKLVAAATLGDEA